jgi:hypothetical protein
MARPDGEQMLVGHVTFGETYSGSSDSPSNSGQP